MRTEIQTYLGRKVFIDLDGYDRVREASSHSTNERVHEEITNNVRRFSRQDKEDITQRINELDHEWDLDRVTTAAFAGVALVGSVLMRKKSDSKRFSLASFVSLTMGGFFLLGLHTVTGWSPLVRVFRKFGFRSKNEISAEKYALKTVRGDYNSKIA